MTIEVSAVLPTFLITLREGVEAALVVGIVLAYLRKADQPQLQRWVYGGIGGGLVASAGIGVVFIAVLQSLERSQQVYATVVKPLLEGGLSVVAIALLSWMLIWMTQQSKSLKTEIESEIGQALAQGAGWGIFGLIFTAVLREGFETVVFVAAQFERGWLPLLGAIAGLLSASAIGVLLFQFGVKINLRQFFQVMGVFLLLIVAGLVISALSHLDRGLGVLAQLDPQFAPLCLSERSCFLGRLVWDFSAVLPDRQFPGIILHTVFGYVDRLYAVEAIAYCAFLLMVGGLYWQSMAGRLLKGDAR
jgi:high-affinity iron transporter